MLGFLAISLFCGWYMWIQYIACKGVYNDEKKNGKDELGFTIFMYLFRCSWAIFLIIYAFIQMINS